MLIHALVLLASTAPLIAVPKFVVKPCDSTLPSGRVTCGTVTVPENPVLPGGRTIDLNVVIVNTRVVAAGAIPMFYLDGGPGMPATAAALFYLGPGAIYAEARAVVLIDQRGTGGSNPLQCPDVKRRNDWDDEYDPRAVDACRRALEPHADLTQYSTENAATDVEMVRAALGYERIDVAALSYGTELAQAYLKRFAARVHAAALAGFVPLDLRQPLFHAINAQRALDLLFYECARDSSCRAKYPRLREDWAAALRRFDGGDVTVTLSAQTIQLRRGPFGELVRNIMGTAAGQRTLPSLIHAAATGDFTGFVSDHAGAAAPVADGLYLSVVCSEAQPRIPADITGLASGTFLGTYRVDQERAACAQWPRHPVSDSFYSPPTDEVPVLVLSGSMDHVAAPEWGWEFCRARHVCTFVSVPGMGHGPFDLDRWTEGDCFDRIAAAFLANPAHVDTACVARMRPPSFR
jgi:pimeloyl-ACP methyl ester carboxylesterase